jgi:hypothetical protein
MLIVLFSCVTTTEEPSLDGGSNNMTAVEECGLEYAGDGGWLTGWNGVVDEDGGSGGSCSPRGNGGGAGPTFEVRLY